MKKNCKFIHCADIHLGAQPLKLEERYNDFFYSFSQVINYAISNKIDKILVSGDVFHVKNINSKTLIKTTAVLKNAKDNGINVLVIEGNHDKAFYVDEDSWLLYLNEVNLIRLLSHKIEEGKIIDIDLYEDEEIQVFGVGYLGSSTENHVNEIQSIINKKRDDSKYKVLMLHAAIDKLSNSDLASVKYSSIECLKESVDYVALGHIHYEYENEFIHNPGSTERIRLDEAVKDKGFYFVEVENGESKIEHIKLANRKHYIKRIVLRDNNKMTDENSFKEYLINYDYSNLEAKSVLVINLYGTLDWNTLIINYDDIKSTIKTKFDLLYVEINNYINVFTDKSEMNEIDFEEIERQEIKKELETHYPNQDVNKMVDNISTVKDLIVNKAESSGILDLIYQSEVFNEN